MVRIPTRYSNVGAASTRTGRYISVPLIFSTPTEQKLPTMDPPEETLSSFSTQKITVAVDPVALITTECITVTSAMRKHARWAQSSVAAILGGSSAGYGGAVSNTPPMSPGRTPSTRGRGRAREESHGSELVAEVGLASRWGLRGKKGKSIQVRSLIWGTEMNLRC